MIDPAAPGSEAYGARTVTWMEKPKVTSSDAESSASGAAVAHEVDATGLSCPMPVIELAKAVEQVRVGELVALIATDPAARVDVPVWCRMQRHLLRGMESTDGLWRFLVERTR